jgi:aryl-alcohol dehydrogenase (NADP+)
VDYVTLGASGLVVSRICMGTMTFGQQASEAESIRMAGMALDAGINFFDTADIYNSGMSEQILGKALRARRGEVVIATKGGNPMGSGPNERGLSRRYILRAAEASLERLNTEYIDVYMLHQPDQKTPLEESLSALDQLVRSGKVRYIGVSNFAAWQVCSGLWIGDRRGFIPITFVQAMYNLLARRVEEELLPFCRHYGLGLVAYNPLAGGLLTGKYKKGEQPRAGTRFGLKENYRNRYWHDRLFDAVEGLRRIGDGAGLSLLDLSFRWLLTQPDLTCLILGASSTDQLRANLAACTGGLPVAVLQSCDEIWQELRGAAPMCNR